MLEERMTISLEEFIKYMIKRWKMVIGLIIIAAACFTAGAVFLGEEISVPHSEEYLHYEQELEWHESYLEESILMNLDPLSIHERTLLLRNISDNELLRNYALSSEIWEEYDTEKSKKYIQAGVAYKNIPPLVGINDIYYFFRTFKSVTGMSPSEYKKQCRSVPL